MLDNTFQNPNQDNRYNLYNFELGFKNYLNAVIENRDTIKNYLSDFRHFSGFAMAQTKNTGSANSNSSISFENNDKNSKALSVFLTEKLILAYKEFLVSSNLPRNTINRRLSTVRKFCTFCITQGWLEENPSRNIENVQKEQKQARINSKRNLSSSENTSHDDDNMADYSNYLEAQGLKAEMVKKEINYVQEFLSTIHNQTIS